MSFLEVRRGNGGIFREYGMEEKNAYDGFEFYGKEQTPSHEYFQPQRI